MPRLVFSRWCSARDCSRAFAQSLETEQSAANWADEFLAGSVS